MGFSSKSKFAKCKKIASLNNLKINNGVVRPAVVITYFLSLQVEQAAAAVEKGSGDGGSGFSAGSGGFVGGDIDGGACNSGCACNLPSDSVSPPTCQHPQLHQDVSGLF